MALTKTPVCHFDLPAIDFDLLGVDNKRYTLADCHRKNGLVVAFICNHCPYVQAILPRLIEDARTLHTLDIGFVAISANDVVDYPEDSFDNMQKLAQKHQFPFPYLWDESQAIARAYGAVCTPDFFGYNSDLKLQYRGRLDDSGMKPAPIGSKRELVAAMQQVANTQQGPREQIPSQGCSIKWRM